MARSEDPVNRRHFFRQGLRELLKPLVEAIEPLEEAVRQLDRMSGPDELFVDGGAVRRLSLEAWLRPPGAATPDRSFLDACSRCGKCVSVCPAQCIRIDPTGSAGHGAPYIDADTMPCVVCDGLHCMHHCPTGALRPIPLADIDMGTAVWHSDTCVRRTGDNCTICVDHCPLGSVAIELRAGRIHVHPTGCIGCGVCQHDCPTDPKSIVVIPRACRDTG
jgi:MauM/NapG family ferredoxin protein